MTRRFPRALAAVLLLGASLLAGCGDGHHTASARRVVPTPAAHQRTGTDSVHVPVAGTFPSPGHPWFLAVGDSITSGFTRDPSRAGVNASWPVQLQPLLAAAGRDWSFYDTACPGETTVTYFAMCPQHRRVSALPAVPQYDLDLRAIAAAPRDLRAIVIDIGSNDLLRAGYAHDQTPAVINGLLGAVEGIVTRLQTAAPGVPMVIANYYDPFENLGMGELPALQKVNAGIAAIAARHGAAVADFFGAVNTATPPAPHLCALIDCADADVHPTVAGHAALARAVLAAIAKR